MKDNNKWVRLLADVTGWISCTSSCCRDGQPLLLVCDPPYGISLDSEWRDRAGLNGCGPAQASYMKQRSAKQKRRALHAITSVSNINEDTAAQLRKQWGGGPNFGG